MLPTLPNPAGSVGRFPHYLTLQVVLDTSVGSVPHYLTLTLQVVSDASHTA